MDHYARLGLPRDADATQVAQAFRRAARETHPDTGGRPGDFVAVAEAHRVLGDPLLRAQYDRELDGEPPSWDEVEWGTEVGADALDAEDVATPAWRDDLRPGAGDPRGDAGSDRPEEPPHLDAFAGPPRRIPDPLVVPAPPAVPSARPSRLERSTAAGASLLGVVALAVLAIAVSRGAWGRTGAATAAGEDGLSTAVAWLTNSAIALVFHAVSPPHTRGTAAAWIFTAVSLVMVPPVVTVAAAAEPGPRELLLTSVAAACAAIVVAVVWAHLFARRRAYPDRLAAMWSADPRWRLDRYHRAVEWNRVLTALERPGATVVAVGPPALDSSGVPVPGLRWTWERSGVESVRVLPVDVHLGSWLVLDEEDRVVASAPAGAPEAWTSALVEVRRPPTHAPTA